MSTKVNLSDALFSKVRQRVLALLYGQPERSFYTNELINLTQSGTGAVQRELRKLAAAGIITVNLVGNQKHYQANLSMPFFAELRSIILKTFGLADQIRQALKPLSAQIQIAFIYGSIARQEDTAKSDIDLMLVSDNNLTYTDLFHCIKKVETKLDRAINPTFYSMAEWAKKRQQNNNFLSAVMKQKKIFLIGTENALKRIR
jgi:predicted nucleotidyltransferase